MPPAGSGPFTQTDPPTQVPALGIDTDNIVDFQAASIIVRWPFTLQYARERVPRELWDSPEFVRTNYVITAAWAGAFAVMVAADLVMLYVPTLPRWVGIAATVGALYGAFSFTDWYPKRNQEKVRTTGF